MPTVTPQPERGRLHAALGLAALHGMAASAATALADFAGTGAFAGWSPSRLGAYFGIHAGAGVLLAALATVAYAGGVAAATATTRAGPEGARRRRRLFGPLPLVALAAAPAFFFADSLFSGAYASRLPLRPGLVAGTTLGLLAAVHVATLLVAWLGGPTERRGRRRGLAALLFAGAAGLSVANQLVLPNLYAAVHALASLATFAGFAAASLALASTLSPERPRAPGPAVTAALYAGPLALFVGVLVTVEHAPVLRLSLFDPRASVSQSLMRGIDPIVSTLAPRGSRRAAASSIAVGPVDALGGPVRRGAHILLVTVDALRADHLGIYGYGRPTSPGIDALARESVVFEHAYAQAPHSSYSLCSLMTSEYLHETLDLGLPLPDETLAGVLRESGYHSAGLYTRGIFHTDGDRLEIYDARRFDLVHRDHRSLEAEERTDAAIAEIDRVIAHGEPPSLLWVHYFDAHEPYRATTFGTRDVDRYDSEIREVDGAVTRLVREARARLARDVIVVLTADHGEEFRDHGGLYHGSSVYEEQIRVPLVVSVPGVTPRRVDAPVEIVDVAPTLLRLVDVEVPPTMRGDDLRGALVGTGALPRMAVSAVLSKRTIIEWPFKLLQDTRYRLTELFDLSADPHERTNLAGRDPERVAALGADLAAFLDGLAQPARAAPDPTALALRRARLRDVRAVEPLTAIALDASAPDETRREAARLLGSLRARSARGALVSLLSDRDARLADEAAIALANLEDAQGRRRLVALVADAEGDLRFRAAVALASLGDARAVPALVDTLGEGEDIRVRRAAAQALGDLGDPRAIDPLIAAMSEWKVRSAAVAALGKIGDRRAYEPIMASLATDRHVVLREAMARALGEIGDPRALPTLIAMASDEPELMNATRAVIRLGALGHGLVGGTSLWGQERPTPRTLCDPPGARPCASEQRVLELPVRVPASLVRGPVQAVLRARVGRGETATVAWEIEGVPLAPVSLDGEAREVRVLVPRGTLSAPRATVRLVVRGAATIVVDHLLLLPSRPTGGA